MYLVLSQYQDEQKIRTARLIETESGYMVEMWREGFLAETRMFDVCHVSKAEDYAEDWVLRA